MVFAAILIGSSGCLPAIDGMDDGPLDSTFAVTDVFTPSGFMGDGATFAHLYMDVNTKCQQPRPTNAKGYCYKFTYYKDTIPTGVSWAGVYWVFPANNWGTRRRPRHGHHQVPSASLQRFGRISPTLARVRGHGSPRREPQLFLRKHQRIREPGRHRWPELPAVSDQLAPNSIPFPDVNPTSPNDSLIGGFGWSIAFPSWADPKSPLVVYVDDIVWDTAAPPATPGTP